MKYKPIPEDIGEYVAISDESPSGLVVIKKWHGNVKLGPWGWVNTDRHGHSIWMAVFRGKAYQLHRVVYFLHNGEDAPKEIDHKNTDSLDNSPSNLRLATRSQNAANRKARGYFFRKDRNKWKAVIVHEGVQKYLGLFGTEEEAKAAYIEAKSEIFGDYACVE